VTGEGTTAVHGDAPREDPHGSIGTPLYRRSTFRFETLAALRAAAESGSDFYTRYGHPNSEGVERKHAAPLPASPTTSCGSKICPTCGRMSTPPSVDTIPGGVRLRPRRYRWQNA